MALVSETQAKTRLAAMFANAIQEKRNPYNDVRDYEFQSGRRDAIVQAYAEIFNIKWQEAESELKFLSKL